MLCKPQEKLLMFRCRIFSVRLLTICCVVLIVGRGTAQRILQVPSDFQSVQSAIDQATNGDTVNIAPGTYLESIHFRGRQITVQGSASGVILQPSSPGPVVTFDSNETRSTVLQNVILKGGSPIGAPSAGGIFINNASPTIKSVTIQGGQGCGVLGYNAAPALQNDNVSGFTIKQTDLGCLPQSSNYLPVGGGIVVYGPPPGGLQAELVGNVVERNQSVFSAGGILVLSAGQPTLRNNIVRNNTGNGLGAGLTVSGDTTPQITQNLIYGNVLNPVLAAPAYSDVGAGMQFDLQTPFSSSSPIIVTNNTVVGNSLLLVSGARSQGSQVFVIGQLQRVQFSNNLIVGSTTQSVVDCSSSLASPGLPTFDHNDVTTTGNAVQIYSGACSNPTGTNGNLSVNPDFSTGPDDPQPYKLALQSPAVDAGDNSAPALPSTDLIGEPRVQDGKGTGVAIVDMGVYELPAAVQPPAQNDFTLAVTPNQLQIQAGHSGSASVTLTLLSGSTGTVQLACSGLPAGSQCSFSPSQVDLAKSSATSMVAFYIGSAGASVRERRNIRPVTLLTLALTLPLCFRRRRAVSITIASILLCAASLGTTGCADVRVPLVSAGAVPVLVTAHSSTANLTRQATVMIDIAP